MTNKTAIEKMVEWLEEQQKYWGDTFGGTRIIMIEDSLEEARRLAAEEAKAQKPTAPASLVEELHNTLTLWDASEMTEGEFAECIKTLFFRYRPQTDIVEAVKAEAIKWANKPTIGFEADEYDRVKGISQGLFMAVEIISKHTKEGGV